MASTGDSVVEDRFSEEEVEVWRPSKCPACASDKAVVEIIYGRPSKELFDRAQEGKVKLGGCCPTEFLKNHCKDCDKDF